MFKFSKLLVLAAIVSLSTGSAFAENKAEKKSAPKEEIAVLETSLGTIKIRFFPDKAPKHVENFKKLANSGFYNGTTFHRVIPNFMIQGGDPLSKNGNKDGVGSGGPGWTVNAEFNDVSHKRGIVSMARSRDPNSAGSQFFICVADVPFLDHQYSAFGEVIEGMDVADKIVSSKRDINDMPLNKIEMKVTIKTR
jgi:peptidylprolyl isomerase